MQISRQNIYLLTEDNFPFFIIHPGIARKLESRKGLSICPETLASFNDKIDDIYFFSLTWGFLLI